MRARVANRVHEIAPPGPVLDVGAGDGALIAALRRAGRPAVGLERNPVGAHVRSGEITDLEGPFAAVVLWHSLEHLRAPADTLREAVDRLLPGGVVVLSLPNSASWQSRAFGERWFALDIPRHLVHLPATAVLQRLGELGLGIER